MKLEHLCWICIKNSRVPFFLNRAYRPVCR